MRFKNLVISSATAALAVTSVVVPWTMSGAVSAATAYVSDFAGTPPAPAPFNPTGWDITAFAGANGAMHPMLADHGPDCSPPPLVPAPLPAQPPTGGSVPAYPTAAPWQHTISNINDAVFQCKNHVMTALFNGYAAVYMTPPAMMDFSTGPSTLSWNMSTLRTASRDWIDVVIMPFDENMQVNFQDNHVPNDAVHVFLAGGGNVLLGEVVRGGYANPNWSGNCEASPQPATCRLPGNSYTTWDSVLAQHGLEPSAQRRDAFQITLSRNHITVGMPDYGFNWIDSDINPPLTWNQGVVQLNHRGYNPEKSCESPNYPQSSQTATNGDIDNPYGATYCRPNTWHWGPVSIAPDAPFTIIPANVRAVSNSTTQTVTFAQPAPAGAFFRGTGNPSPSYISFDNGRTYQLLPTVGVNNDAHPELGNSFWMPVPVGTQTVMLKGYDAGSTRWSIIDMSLWANTGPTASASSGALFATATTVPPTSTAVPPTSTAVPPTATRVPATSTPTSAPATTTPVAITPPAVLQMTGNAIGNTHVGASLDSGDANYMNGSRITTGDQAVSAKSISVYVDGPIDTTAFAAYQVAIYSDANGTPGALLGQSATGTLVAHAWNTLPVTATLAPHTSYWLIYNTNGRASHLNNLRQDNGAAGDGVYSNSKVAFGTWPRAFGAATTGTWKRSIYLNY